MGIEGKCDVCGGFTRDYECIRCYRRKIEALELQNSELKAALGQAMDACPTCSNGGRCTVHPRATHDLLCSPKKPKGDSCPCGIVGEVLVACERHAVNPDRVIWMVTRACVEHKHLGADYEMKPFWGPPVVPCPNCKYQQVLEQHQFGGITEKRKCYSISPDGDACTLHGGHGVGHEGKTGKGVNVTWFC